MQYYIIKLSLKPYQHECSHFAKACNNVQNYMKFVICKNRMCQITSNLVYNGTSYTG